MFSTNVGGIYRILRIALGLLLIALAITGKLVPWGWIGLVPLLTGIFSTCPLYSLIGINSCPRRR